MGISRSGSAALWALAVKSANSDVADMFGTSVAIGPDTIAAGTTGESSCFTNAGGVNSCAGEGAAYIFR